MGKLNCEYRTSEHVLQSPETAVEGTGIWMDFDAQEIQRLRFGATGSDLLAGLSALLGVLGLIAVAVGIASLIFSPSRESEALFSIGGTMAIIGVLAMRIPLAESLNSRAWRLAGKKWVVRTKLLRFEPIMGRKGGGEWYVLDGLGKVDLVMPTYVQFQTECLLKTMPMPCLVEAHLTAPIQRGPLKLLDLRILDQSDERGSVEVGALAVGQNDQTFE